MRSFLFFLLSIGILSAENAALKIATNMPVFYQLHIEGGVKTDGKNPQINFKAFTLDLDFSAIVKNDNEYFPEIIITPTKFAGLLKFNHGNAVFDFSKENLTFNSILLESFPFLNAIKLNQPFRIPVSDNPDFLSHSHQNYPILPLNNSEGYASFARKLQEFIAHGAMVKQGRAHATIPELGLEVYSAEKLVGDQYKGDYTFRFLLPFKNKRSGCSESVIGGGKIKNSAFASNVLNTTAHGIVIMTYQKMNCPKKELEEFYEFRGKITLTPKAQTISALTRS